MTETNHTVTIESQKEHLTKIRNLRDKINKYNESGSMVLEPEDLDVILRALCLHEAVITLDMNRNNPQTNLVKLQHMSDEELADFLSENANCTTCTIQCKGKDNCPSESSCYCEWLNWLNATTKEMTT